MKLNHMDLQVNDVQETAKFLEKYFSFKLITSPTAKAIAVLHGETGFTLVLQKLKNPEEKYPSGFHIGFLQESPADVYEMFNRLKNDGIEVGESVQQNNRGTMFYFMLAGEILTEVGCNRKI